MLGDEVRDPRTAATRELADELVPALNLRILLVRHRLRFLGRVVSSAHVELPTISLSLLSPLAPRKNNIQGSVAAALSFWLSTCGVGL